MFTVMKVHNPATSLYSHFSLSLFHFQFQTTFITYSYMSIAADASDLNASCPTS